MIKEAMEFIASLQKQATAKVRVTAQLEDGRIYFSDDGKLIEPAAPRALAFHTLAGFAAYINANHDEVARAGHIVHVVSPVAVGLVSRLDDSYQTRHEEASAYPCGTAVHPFANYLDTESFIIWLLSGFVQDEAATAVLKVVGNLKAEKVTTQIDDGVTQMAAVRAGVTRSGEMEIKNPVWLRPFRTFDEVEQPPSPLVLRLHEQQGGAPKVALIKSADESWQGLAMRYIAEKIRELLTDKTIPVLA